MSFVRNLVAAALAAAGLAAQADPSDLCLTAARNAAAMAGVPPETMIAVGLAESGRRRDGALRPWPWTANLNGEGYRFETPAELLAFAESAIARGDTSIDLGCFQVNYRWHGSAFASVAQMIEPVANATYAAGFLRDLVQELGDWDSAVGAYHSRTSPLARAYSARVADLRAGLPDEGDFPAITLPQGDQVVRGNAFPLLTGNGGGALGSLVPLGQGDGA